MGSVRDLINLDLSHNRLSGEIPAELGSLRRLSFLYLNDNQLTGEIPSGTGRAAGAIRWWEPVNRVHTQPFALSSGE